MRSLAIVCALVGLAHAERPRTLKIDVGPHRTEARALPPLPYDPTSRVIYMRRCPLAGCPVHFAPDDDSRFDASSIAEGTRTIGAFRQSDDVWNALMQCMRATYAPFNIGVTDVDPGSQPHFEHVVGGFPSDLRSDIQGAGGVAPFSCAEIPNAMSYTFDVYGPDPLELCWTAAQETAHAFGLEHEVNSSDPMTYLTGPLPKRFQAADVSCGEFSARACDCGNASQNSYMHIVGMFGPGAPTPPTVAITAPTSNKEVQPHFVTRVAATDDVAIDRVELYIDGTKATESKVAPYKLVAPDVPEGPHAVEVRAFDVQGTPASAFVDVVVGPPCTASKGCTDDDVCVDGVCLPGPDVAGGLGQPCQAATECISNQCVTDSESGDKFCVEPCSLSDGSCPHDFACIQNSASGGVCWPDEGGCLCSGGSPTTALLFAGGVLVVVLRRRRA